MLKIKNSFLVILFFLLSSCVGTQIPAPINSPKGITSENTLNKLKYKEDIIIEDINDDILEKPTKDFNNNLSYKPICITKYEVMEGETIESIANYFGITPQELIYANNLIQGEPLQPLQILCIPRKTNLENNIGTVQNKEDSILNKNSIPQEVKQDHTENNTSITPNMTYKKEQKSFFIWPVTGKVIVKFGDYIKNTKNNGINIEAKIHTKVLASYSGKVIFSSYDKYFGNLVIIENSESKISTAYAHLESITVKKNEYVNQGKLIGYVGNSGHVSTPQLHFAVKKNSETIDPLSLLN